jgi:hypothetical protein
VSLDASCCDSAKAVAGVIDIEEFRRFHSSTYVDDPLLHGLKSDELADLLDHIVADRTNDLPRDIDLDAQ